MANIVSCISIYSFIQAFERKEIVKIKRIIEVLISLLFIISITPSTAYAAIDVFYDDEECEHNYEATDYDYSKGIIIFTCAECGDSYNSQMEAFVSDSVKPMSARLVEADGNYDTEDHNYEITAFDGNYGIALVTCKDCGNYFNDSFIDHISYSDPGTGEIVLDTYVDWFDVVHDDVINGKDYAYLLLHHTSIFDSSTSDLINVLSDNNFYYKEIFFYVYFTVLFLVLFLIFSLINRRLK